MRSDTNEITNGVIWKQLLLFFFPLLFGSFFQQLYNTVDTIIVGRYVGKEALSAVGGSSATIVSLFVGFFLGISSGAGVVVAQVYGAQKEEEVRRAVHASFALSFIGGVLLTVLGWGTAPHLVALLRTPSDAFAGSVSYLRIYFLGMIPNLLYNMGAGILRAVGDAKRPLRILIFSCAVNIVLDYAFVVWLPLEVTGVALATVLSQTLSAVYVLVVLARSEASYRLRFKAIRPDRTMNARILYIGLPAACQAMTYTVSNMLIQSAINSFDVHDTVVSSAWAVYGKVDALFWMCISSLGIAITTFVGQNFGAGKPERVKQSVRDCYLMGCAIALLTALLFFLAAQPVFSFFTKDADVVVTGVYMVKYLSRFYVLYVGVEIFSGALRGMGDSFLPTLITVFGVALLRVAWILIMLPQHRSLDTVLNSYPITWSVTTVLFVLYYFYYTRRKQT